MENKSQEGLWFIFGIIMGAILLMLMLVAFGQTPVQLKEERDYAIQYGAEQVVLALELGASCQALSNLTSQEIENYWTENYFLSKLKENNKQS